MQPISRFIDNSWTFVRRLLRASVYWGRHPASVPDNAIIFLPCLANTLACGLAGIVAYNTRRSAQDRTAIATCMAKLRTIAASRSGDGITGGDQCLEKDYLGGQALVDSLLQSVRTLKTESLFYDLFVNRPSQDELCALAKDIWEVIASETRCLQDRIGRLPSADLDLMTRRIDDLKDIHWCLTHEIVANIAKIQKLMDTAEPPPLTGLTVFKQINAVLNSIDRLEVRGRDSAGISLMFVLADETFAQLAETLKTRNLWGSFQNRCNQEVLLNLGISLHRSTDGLGRQQAALAFTYKVAAEIGRLGDNVAFLRRQIRQDQILQTLAGFPRRHYTVSAHTRWASVGAISEPNCHPVDHRTGMAPPDQSPIMHVCLNGDIDNYQQLRREYERNGHTIPEDITTDTKIIPLQISRYLELGHGVAEAFRLAVNDFEGSHAISMHTDLAPGKLFLAQKGSGQAIFIGLAEDHYMPTSEVYGLVEETPRFIKINGEKGASGAANRGKGQIFILDQASSGGLEGITALHYDRTPIELGAQDIQQTAITSRDIDRQDYPHYFLKEISEAPSSVEKTLQNRWCIQTDPETRYAITLDHKTFPSRLKDALVARSLRRIYFVGQGTAGIAAQVCADLFNTYLNDPHLQVNAFKASELSGFKLGRHDQPDSLQDALVIAISQSGTTTDTNRTVDMVKERGAHTIAIVNRRDSDITFKVDGVMYTSSGRDIEMSVASTKAFYSQIVAGAVLGLHVARLLDLRSDGFVSAEIQQLLELPGHMRRILDLRERIEASARRLAVSKTYWAAVGSGPNKSAADEIRIKLSELCYKTISSDYVEDKKHIDLSSEPLIIVCAAGTRGTVIGDIVKDTAIFQAHKATPIIIADEGENRFDPYAADVIHVPAVSEHLAPILNTMAGHIWGYYAALSINESSRFLYGFREEIQNTINASASQGMDVYELVLEKSFREKFVAFYKTFREKKAAQSFPAAMGLEAAADLTLLTKYLTGRLPVADFEIDFDKKGTALNMLNALLKCLGESISCLARPIDAIRHQAKTVTVGTSRLSEKVEGILFDALAAFEINVSQLINRNILVLKNIQPIIAAVKGAILYRISRLNLLGEPTEDTTIEIVKKEGILTAIPSRVETDNSLKGTKRIIVREGNVYIGMGRKDGRSIIIIPVISASPAAPNMIEYLLLLNIAFYQEVPLPVKVKALGGKHERIKNIVQENSITWDDRFLEQIEMQELFGLSAEKIGEFIVARNLR